MNKIAIRSKKGGVGKTTTSANIAHYFTMKEKTVCLVDCDPQHNLTTMLGVTQEDVSEKGTLRDILNDKNVSDIVIDFENRPNLALIPSNNQLAHTYKLFDDRQPELTLRKVLELKFPKELFDFIIFDCPPGSNPLIDNVLCYVQHVWCPLQGEFFSLEGIEQVIEELSDLNENFGPLGVDVKIDVVIPTMINTRLKINQDVLDFAKQRYKTFITPPVRRNTKLSESPSNGMTIFEYDSNCTGSNDYKKLGEVLLDVTKNYT